jgi:hypothetical protein
MSFVNAVDGASFQVKVRHSVVSVAPVRLAVRLAAM